MNNSKFQQLVSRLLESNTAGAGGCLGTPAQPIYDPNTQITSGDTYALGDARNVFGLNTTKKPSKKKAKKHPLAKFFPKMMKRNFPETML